MTRDDASFTSATPRVAVVGAGSWGTAFATHLVSRGIPTVLMARRAEQMDYMRRHRHNPDYLDFLTLPATLEYATYPKADLSPFRLVVIAVPSKAFKQILASLGPRLSPGVGVLSLTKGIEPESRARLSTVIQEVLASIAPAVAVLSGPNQAEEVALGQPTASVIASSDIDYARYLQELISDEVLRAYVNADIAGVELAGAVKNIVALATGMSDGLGYGDNARAALITRGLAEMTRLGRALGAKPQTFAGLAGLGDLVGTCTSHHSRNRLAGDLIARGYSPAVVEEEIGMIAEGLTTAPPILALAAELGIDLPITENVVAVIRQGKDVRSCVHDLMSREPRQEDA
ncbi:MAG: NAD(P)-dependent glycerol-3-phosphate dehydrogenase [Actinobacteria bacterium]|nr:NAD(P)-dependent glycerol-3-phosphate dehydrogenase [Actinomycetota bacterium]